jgi:hypothetical protein
MQAVSCLVWMHPGSFNGGVTDFSRRSNLGGWRIVNYVKRLGTINENCGVNMLHDDDISLRFRTSETLPMSPENWYIELDSICNIEQLVRHELLFSFRQ